MSSRRRRTPLYQQIETDLGRRIRQDEFVVGDKLPSERELCESYGVSRITVKQALGNLVQAGWIVSHPGKGYFVASGNGAEAPGTNGGPEGRYEEAHLPDPLPGHGVLRAPAVASARRRITFGILNELPDLADLWAEVLGRFEKESGVAVVPRPIHGTRVFEEEPAALEADVLQAPGFLVPYLRRRGWFFDPRALGGLDVPPETFHAGLAPILTQDGALLGVPLTVGVICQYFNRACESSLRRIPVEGGFWRYLDGLRDWAYGTDRREGSRVISRHTPFLLWMLTQAAVADLEDVYWNFDNPALEAFLLRLEPYATDPRLFYPQVDGRSHYHFMNGAGQVVWGSSSWMAMFLDRGCPFAWGMLPEACEAAGAVQMDTNLNAISAYTAYPEESLALLQYLAREDVQAAFARRGRLVAHREAYRQLHLPLGDGAREALLSSLPRGRVLTSFRPDLDDFLNGIVCPEMTLWMRGISTTATFIEKVAAKSRVFQSRRDWSEPTPASERASRESRRIMETRA